MKTGKKIVTVEDRNAIIKSFFEDCSAVLASKGKDYAGKCANDQFYNMADQLGLTPHQVWAVYFMKHIAAILNYCKKGQVESEHISQRILDAINYLVILYTITTEQREDEK